MGTLVDQLNEEFGLEKKEEKIEEAMGKSDFDKMKASIDVMAKKHDEANYYSVLQSSQGLVMRMEKLFKEAAKAPQEKSSKAAMQKAIKHLGQVYDLLDEVDFSNKG